LNKKVKKKEEVVPLNGIPGTKKKKDLHLFISFRILTGYLTKHHSGSIDQIFKNFLALFFLMNTILYI
jgi:hypothetical protein